jgi:DNA polymerase III alpha subunit
MKKYYTRSGNTGSPGSNCSTSSTGNVSNTHGYTCPYYVLAAGIIITKRIEKTKDSKSMMFCTMEDEDGMFEAVFFPESYNRNARVIMNSSFILLKGRLHLKDNSVSLVVRDVYSMSELKKIENLKREEKVKTELLASII